MFHLVDYENHSVYATSSYADARYQLGVRYFTELVPKMKTLSLDDYYAAIQEDYDSWQNKDCIEDFLKIEERDT